MRRRTTAVLFLAAVVTVAALVAGCGGFGDSPAKVGDVYIDANAFTSQVEGQAATYGITAENDPDSYALIQDQVMEQLIESELAAQKAAVMGITVEDSEVDEVVDEITTYYFSGDEEQMKEALQAESLTLNEFREQIRDSLAVEKVQAEVVQDIPEPTEDEIAAYYEENKDDFLTDTRVEARHILVAAGDQTVNSFATTTTESTTATTEAADADSATSDSTTTSEATTTTTLPEVEWAQALATAAQVRADLLAGGSWNTLAARYSDDLDTKNDGGYLGVVASGELADTLGLEFDNALFSLDEGQISEPIRTENGYEVIQVITIVDPEPMSLEEASEDVAAAILATAQNEAWQTFLDEARAEIGVEYNPKYQTTTTTVEETATTVAPSEETTVTEP